MYYRQYQWNSFTDIMVEEQKKYQNLKRLNYIFSEIICLEREYADGLSRLEGCFNNLGEFGTFGATLKTIFDSLKKKSQYHLTFVERVKSIIKPEIIEDYFKNQKNLHSRYENEEAKFIEYAKKVDNAKLNYHKCFSDNEKILQEQSKKEIDSSKSNKKTERFKELELIARQEYCKAIIEGNEKRNEYVTAINEIFDQCENLDTEIILRTVNHIKSFFSKENEMSNSIIQANQEIVDKSDLVNEKDDIKLFCESNHRHGQPPNKFDFVVYKQDYNYPSLLNKPKANLASEYVKQVFKAYGYFPPKGIEDKSLNQKYKIVEMFAVKSWVDGLAENEMKQLLDLFEDRDYRLHFLKCANHFRLELFPIKNHAFDTVAVLMKKILEKSIEAQKKDYESIKFVIILSQTFYKDNPETNEAQYLLQNVIMNEPMWNNREIWKGLIDFSYELDLIGNLGSKRAAVNDDLEERINKEQTTMTITLITFKFIMKCFGYNSKDCNEILKEYCIKYGINQQAIFDNEDDDITEIQNELVKEMNQPQIAKENVQQLVEQANEGGLLSPSLNKDHDYEQEYDKKSINDIVQVCIKEKITGNKKENYNEKQI